MNTDRRLQTQALKPWFTFFGNIFATKLQGSIAFPGNEFASFGV